jgi:hypothetical protein
MAPHVSVACVPKWQDNVRGITLGTFAAGFRQSSTHAGGALIATQSLVKLFPTDHSPGTNPPLIYGS